MFIFSDEEDIMAADEKREVRRIVKRPNAGVSSVIFRVYLFSCILSSLTSEF